MTEDFEEFVRGRREQTEQTRRLLIRVLVGACIALAVSNVALALWITSGRARQTVEAPGRPSREARRAPAAEPPPPSASVPSRPASAPNVTLPKTTEPAPAEPRTATAPAETPRADPRAPAESASPERDLPSRSPAPTAAAPRTAANAPSAPARAMATTPGFAAPEEATAAWMLTTYGRPDAEARARAALEFYDAKSSEGRYWRRVLGLITAAR